MRNFLRCLRVAWSYRHRLIFSVACAFFAALFWSATFLAIHPVLKILGGNRPLADSVQADIDQVEIDTHSTRDRIERLRTQLDDPDLGDEPRRTLTGQLSQAEMKVLRADLAIYRLRMLKSLYARFLPADRFRALVWLMLAFLGSIALKGVFEAIQESLVGSVTNFTIRDLRNRFFRSAIRLDVNHFAGRGAHDLTARCTNDAEVLGAGLKSLFGKVVSEPLRALACIGAACFISWRLTLLFLVLVPLGGYVMARVGRAMKRASKRLMERMSDLHKVLNESLQGIRVVKAFTAEPYERLRCRLAAREFYRRSMRVVHVEAVSGPVIEVMGVAGVVLALLAGAYLVLNAKTHLWGIRLTSMPLDHETLLTYYALLAAIADPLRKLSSVYTKLHSAAAAADRIYEDIDRLPRVASGGLTPRLPLHGKSIEFRGVTFGYDPARPVLSGIDLSFRFGETVAFVGRNGCGKSTLLNLLPRFFDPDAGNVLIDGIDIRGVNLRGLRRQLALVTQDTILFDDTIANNIAYGHRRISRERIEEAARRAFAHDFIERLPHGYATRAGDMARSLSGGERQRIALARAILRDPRLLILDEFTSQIDAESEAKIHLALREFIKGRTTLMITHRLHALETVDRIVVLERGRVDAVGTHAELLTSSATYQSLYESQSLQRAA